MVSSPKNIITTPVEKKKRGRKPKPKPEVEEIKTPKKRGRKPKLKIVSQEDKNKFILPSKRGRKPKDKTIILNKNLNLDNISNVILHLPISLDIINKINDELKINKNKEPNPYDPCEHKDMKIDDNEVNCIYKNVTKNIDQEVNTKKNNLDSTIHFYNNYINDNYSQNINNVNCNWCLHECKDDIVKLPYNVINGVFNMYGNFCCPECAAAFNFNEINDENVWERYSLLNYLYNDNSYKYNIAPSRLLLNIFGGPLDIDEYREIINTNKTVNMLMPPLHIIKPQIEIVNNQDIYIPLNINRIDKYTKDLKLKRQNNTVKTNTLDLCMNLKYK